MFKVGQNYTRADVAELIDYPKEKRSGGAWMTGGTEFNDCYYIFANIGLPGRTGHDYPNRWYGKELILTGRTGSRRGQPQIERIISGELVVHVFWRCADKQPFTYAGRPFVVDVVDSSPVEITWAFDDDVASNEPIDSDTTLFPVWRRGPRPTEGERKANYSDKPTDLYCMKLEGVSKLLHPGLTSAKSIVKVGISSSPVRRLRDHNSGYPPGLSLRWALVHTSRYPNGPAAFAAEGRVLERLRSSDAWIGGEFAIVELSELMELAEFQQE